MPASKKARKSRMRLIVIDDHPEIISTVTQLLRANYNIVATSGTGSEGLAAIAACAPDGVVLDIAMPDLSGLEVARRLKAMHSPARIVFLTVHADADYVKEAFAAGANGYVLKSQLISDLPTALKKALAGDSFISPSIR